MEVQIERLVRRFEEGCLTRRQLVQRVAALAALACGGRVSAQPAAFQAVGLNHIALGVPDVARSRAFYTRLLALEVRSESPGSAFLNCGNQFVALFRRAEAGLDHYCYSVSDYHPDSAADKLRAEGLTPRITGGRVYFEDPDGLTVQLSSPDLRAS